MDYVVVTRHQVLVEVLRDRGIIAGDVMVIDHVTDPEVLRGKVVIGILPLHLACLAEEIIAPEIDVPAELRGKELSREELEKFFKGVRRYRVLALD